MTAPLTMPRQLITIRAAHEWVRRNRAHGVTCPGCDQYAKAYRRQINSGMARSLIAMSRYGTDWVNVPRDIGARSREEGKLAYWGLIEESTQPRDDGGRAGWWRLTDRGTEFVNNRVRVAKYVWVYDDQVLGFEGKYVSIRDALSTKFNYDELMANR